MPKILIFDFDVISNRHFIRETAEAFRLCYENNIAIVVMSSSKPREAFNKLLKNLELEDNVRNHTKVETRFYQKSSDIDYIKDLYNSGIFQPSDVMRQIEETDKFSRFLYHTFKHAIRQIFGSRYKEIIDNFICPLDFDLKEIFIFNIAKMFMEAKDYKTCTVTESTRYASAVSSDNTKRHITMRQAPGSEPSHFTEEVNKPLKIRIRPNHERTIKITQSGKEVTIHHGAQEEASVYHWETFIFHVFNIPHPRCNLPTIPEEAEEMATSQVNDESTTTISLLDSSLLVRQEQQATQQTSAEDTKTAGSTSTHADILRALQLPDEYFDLDLLERQEQHTASVSSLGMHSASTPKPEKDGQQTKAYRRGGS
jgi:hypothetical protein